MKALAVLIVGLFLTGCAVTTTTGSGTRITTSVGITLASSCYGYYYHNHGCSTIYLGPGYVVVPHRHYNPRPYYRYYRHEHRTERHYDRRDGAGRGYDRGRGNDRRDGDRNYRGPHRNTPQR